MAEEPQSAADGDAYEGMMSALRQVVAVKRIGDPIAFLAELKRVQVVCAIALSCAENERRNRTATRPLSRMKG